MIGNENSNDADEGAAIKKWSSTDQSDKEFIFRIIDYWYFNWNRNQKMLDTEWA